MDTDEQTQGARSQTLEVAFDFPAAIM